MYNLLTPFKPLDLTYARFLYSYLLFSIDGHIQPQRKSYHIEKADLTMSYTGKSLFKSRYPQLMSFNLKQCLYNVMWLEAV